MVKSLLNLCLSAVTQHQLHDDLAKMPAECKRLLLEFFSSHNQVKFPIFREKDPWKRLHLVLFILVSFTIRVMWVGGDSNMSREKKRTKKSTIFLASRFGLQQTSVAADVQREYRLALFLLVRRFGKNSQNPQKIGF